LVFGFGFILKGDHAGREQECSTKFRQISSGITSIMRKAIKESSRDNVVELAFHLAPSSMPNVGKKKSVSITSWRDIYGHLPQIFSRTVFLFLLNLPDGIAVLLNLDLPEPGASVLLQSTPEFTPLGKVSPPTF
jgi:hypothetical protein